MQHITTGHFATFEIGQESSIISDPPVHQLFNQTFYLFSVAFFFRDQFNYTIKLDQVNITIPTATHFFLTYNARFSAKCVLLITHFLTVATKLS